ncbi:MAG: hypothetical protein ACK5P7_00115 [Bdellovibrio sp.]|jgi:hypothetical protein
MFKLFSSLALFLFVLLLLPTTVVAFGKLPGTVEGLKLGNSHFVAQREGSVYRAEGNCKKPAQVNAQIHQNLNPVFAKLATLIESGELKWSKLCKSVGRQTVETGDPANWKCR